MTDFWIGFIIGYILSSILFFIIECICIVSGKSDLDRWMEEVDDESD